MDARLVFDPQTFTFDLGLSGTDLEGDEGLASAVLLSLFTDRRALDDDPIPAGDDPRGWWGDTGATVAGDQLGSRLWLLWREKQTPETLRRAESYAAEALQWLLDDGVASAVTVVATAPRLGVLLLEITITRPRGDQDRYRFESFWAGG